MHRGSHLRILVTNWHDRTSPHAGGAEVHLHEVFGRLARRGHDVILLCSGSPGAERIRQIDDIMVHRSGGRHSFGLVARKYYAAQLRHRQFDVAVEDLNKVPLLLHRWVPAPTVLLVHHLWSTTALRAAGPLVGTSAWSLEAALLRAYRGRPVQAVSDSTARDLVGRGFRAADIRVIHNGVVSRCHAGEKTDPDPRPTLVFVGRLQRYKRVDLLLQVVARVRERVPEVRLVVIGDGPEAPHLRARAVAQGLTGAVEFLGSAAEDVKLDVLRRSWLHVTASEREGWGLTVLEAGACGVPTVACDVAGLRDSVLHDRTGLLVPDGDAVAFADAAASLLARPDRRAQLGEAARRLTAHYTWDRAAAATEEHLQEVAALGRSRRGWEPLDRAPIERRASLSRVGLPPLPYGRERFVLLVGGDHRKVPLQVTFGSEDPSGHRPAMLLNGLPAGAELALHALSSAADAVPVDGGLLVHLSGWPARPERWLWEELGAALGGLRPLAVYRC